MMIYDLWQSVSVVISANATLVCTIKPGWLVEVIVLLVSVQKRTATDSIVSSDLKHSEMFMIFL